MDSPEFSMLSSLRGDFGSEDFIQPHYKEAYRLAIDQLVKGGRDSYQEFLKGERLGSFLSEEELLFITTNTKKLPPQNHTDDVSGSPDTQSSSGTYWPVHSDVLAPDLDLGWPEVMHEKLQTNIDLLFHPPRLNSPTIKEVIRKHIQDARQVVGIVMDVFTDVDIFREIVDASIRGVPVYVLLDDFHLKSFVTMAENQDVKIQQLRNLRVRTVKGQDYLCRSGATFHGAMKQKFLLVDCHTAIYGSYSFAWSFEKINLSMVQVIKGHLVKSYDEEFRTLYARSTVPPQLSPPEGLFQRNGPLGQQNLLISHSGQKLERRNQLRHSLDAVYRKTCERKFATRDLEETLFEDEAMKLPPLLDNGFVVQDQVSRLQSSEAINFLKRHSYAGEGQDGHAPQNMRPRASNWNIRETENGPGHYPVDNYLQPHMYRGQNMRQSYNGIDKQVLSVQQNMPTLENTSKSFMRTWRIESYLKNDDMPFGDSCDYLDQFEPMDKNGSFMQGRMRSSLVMRSTIPEQMEPYRYIHSTGVGSSAAPLHYSSMQWNPPASAENRMNNADFMLTRPGLENSRNNTSFGPGRNSYQAAYASLGRAKGGQIITNPEILGDGWHKRHSVADPRSNTDYVHESSGPVYGGLGRINRSTAGMSAQNGEYGPNLNGDQRSLSHYDVKSMTSANGPNTHKWPELPSRAVSAAALDLKANGTSPQHCSRNSSSKMKSLLNIPERKEDPAANVDTASLTSGGSTDTLTAGDEERTPGGGGGKQPQSKSSSEEQGNPVQVHVKPSKPRLRTEEPKAAPQKKPSIFDRSARTSLDRESWRKERGADGRLYSRFEPFCSFEKKPPARPAQGSASEKSKSLPKADSAAESSLGRPARGHHENKLERFFHRMGNLIHKNK